MTFLDATRDAYDKLSVAHDDLVGSTLDRLPVDRALFALFADLVRDTGGTRVADVGSGPGRVTAALAAHGMDAFGIDLSPGMVAFARRTFPHLRFEVGSMLALDLPDGSLDGLLAHYSIIHVPWERRPDAFAEFHRVLVPGGQVMVAFQVGTDRRHYSEVDGLAFSLDFYRQQPDEVAALLDDAGFEVRVRVVREPEPDREKSRQGYLLARKR